MYALNFYPTHNDVKGKSIDFLRNLYAQSGLSIKPKTTMSKIEQLKTIIEAWGMNPNEILSREALTRPNRTVIDMEQRQIGVLNLALKEAIIKELQEKTPKRYIEQHKVVARERFELSSAGPEPAILDR